MFALPPDIALFSYNFFYKTQVMVNFLCNYIGSTLNRNIDRHVDISNFDKFYEYGFNPYLNSINLGVENCPLNKGVHTKKIVWDYARQGLTTTRDKMSQQCIIPNNFLCWLLYYYLVFRWYHYISPRSRIDQEGQIRSEKWKGMFGVVPELDVQCYIIMCFCRPKHYGPILDEKRLVYFLV